MILHPEVNRLAKYGTVGLSSLIVGLTIFNVLYHFTGRLIFSNGISFVISVFNGFIWNRHWTFKEKRGESPLAQWSKFLVVNLVGYTLNITIVVLLLAEYTRQTMPASTLTVWDIAHGVIYHSQSHVYSFIVVNGAGLMATAAVTVWNFLINRAWTFRH
jgi:putative flippase GtrA